MTAVAETAATVFDESSFADDWSLRVVLRRDSDDTPIGEELLSEADLAEARAELWLDGFLRRGAPETPYETIATRLAPVLVEDRCVGFVMEATASDKRFRRAFGVHALAPTAQRAADRLVEQKVLERGDLFRFSVRPQRGAANPPGPEAIPMTVTARPTPLAYQTRPLAPLLADARRVGTVDEQAFTVLFGATAHEKADRFARKGAQLNPAVETGAVLVGTLGACPESGELYVCVHDALEVFDAAQREFALIYTSQTWSRVQTLLQSQQTQGRSRQMVGQAHGHNFRLEGEPCAACATAPECGRTTVFVSAADRAFMRTVFCRQPWAICWIAGTTLRGDNVARLYTTRGGVLRERGYHVVADEALFHAPGVLPGAEGFHAAGALPADGGLEDH
jgi:hypothetical protein